MQALARVVATLGLALCAGACAKETPALILSLASELTIPTEANLLDVRVMRAGETLETGTYALGEAPRDGWPQTLPIVAGPNGGAEIVVSAELRSAAPGSPSTVVGFGQLTVTLPREGTTEGALSIARACVDRDLDGYGAGFGCAEPDCNDQDPQIPAQRLCAPPGPQPNPVDGGPGPAGDGGVSPGLGCGSVVCGADQACAGDYCFKRCQTTNDCGALYLGCLTSLGICICRAPCANRPDECGPYECLDGCCQL